MARRCERPLHRDKGEVRRLREGRGNVTQTEYSSAYSYAYPTKVTTPVPDSTGVHGSNTALTTLTAYDLATGLPTSITDANGQVTTISYADPVTGVLDPLLRVRKVTAPNGHQTITEYGVPDATGQLPASQRFVKVRSQIDATNWKEAYTWADGLGRTIKTQSVDSAGDVFVETVYDSMGRVWKATNPYRTGDTVHWTENTFDAAGRPWKVTTPDGAVVETTYSLATAGSHIGTVVTVKDQALKQRRSITNALGQLIRVDEPDKISGLLGSVTAPVQPTYYEYNTLGKMVHVQQDVQHRWFMYDSLGRLLRVKQPEQDVNGGLNTTGNPGNNSWTAGFAYDNNGNVLQATDAKGTTITNTYDALNRPLTRTYSNEPQGVSTPAVTNSYDGVGISPAPGFAKGKLTKVTSSVSESRYTDFDAVGRLKQFQQITDGQTYTSSYEYNLSGALIKETYPSGRVVENEFDANGDLAKIFGKATPASIERTYANNFTYSPDGKIERLRLGSGVWESAKFNSRLQVTELSVGWGPSSGSIWKMATEYGELQANGTVDLTKNSGNIGKQTVSFSGLAQPFVQTFVYDSLQRLTEAKETNNGNQTWREVFDYDRYGNRTTHDKFIGTSEVTQTDETRPEIDAAKNRFKPTEGYTFDANGNIVVDFNGRQFTFNGDNKQTQVKDSQNNVIGTYYFDGEGKRVKKVVGAETTIFVYSGGKLIAEYSTETPPTNPTTRFTITDHLGSPRVILDSAGDVISRRDFLPFGEEIAPDTTYRTDALKYGRTDHVRQKFTGYQADEETGLDFAEARMYENRHGRFTAVDPLLASGKSADPQTFNRYVYVMNNPLVLTDPDGLQAGSKDNTKKEVAFAIDHPDVALRVGFYDKYGTNLTSIASRFAHNAGFNDNDRTGGETNALRHAIWSALITSEYGPRMGKEATDAHEPQNSVEIPANGTFQDKDLADTAVDLENNAIGIELGQSSRDQNPKEIAIKALDTFKNEGLFVTKINADGTETIMKTKIGDAEYKEAVRKFNGRNALGFTPEAQKALEDKRKKQFDENYRRAGAKYQE